MKTSTDLKDFDTGAILMLNVRGVAEYPFENKGEIPNREYYEKCGILDKLNFSETDERGRTIWGLDQIITHTRKQRGNLMRQILKETKQNK